MKNYFPCELKMDFLFGRVCTEGKKWANWSLHWAENSIQFEFSLTAFAWSNHHSWRTGREKLVLSYNVSVSVFSYCFLCFFVLWRKRCECQRERKKPVVFSYLDVCSRQVILCQDEVIEGDIICYCHTAGVDLEDPSFGLLIGKGKLNLTVDSPWGVRQKTKTSQTDCDSVLPRVC